MRKKSTPRKPVFGSGTRASKLSYYIRTTVQWGGKEHILRVQLWKFSDFLHEPYPQKLPVLEYGSKSLPYFIRGSRSSPGLKRTGLSRRTLWEAADDDLIAGDAGPDLVLNDGVDGLGGAPQSLNVRLLLQVVQRFCEHERASSIMQVFTVQVLTTVSSAADPWYFGVDPDPRIHAAE